MSKVLTTPLKIEKKVPIPTRRRENSAYEEVMRKLEVGDSFRVELSNTPASFQAIAARIANSIGIKVTVRSVKEDGVGYWRIWRIED